MERKITGGTYRDYIFLFGDSRTVYSDFSVKKSDKFMAEHGHKFLEYFSRRNFKIYSFADAPQKYLEQLYHSQDNFFENPLDVKKFFDGYEKNLVEKNISCLSVKDDKLAAYYLAISPDRKNI